MRPGGNQSLDQNWIEFIQAIVVGMCNGEGVVGILACVSQVAALGRNQSERPQCVIDAFLAIDLSSELQSFQIRFFGVLGISAAGVDVPDVRYPVQLAGDVPPFPGAPLGFEREIQ